MNSSSAKTLGIILVVLAGLALIGVLRFFMLIPLGIADGIGHGVRSSLSWFWPWAGFGFFALLALCFWILVTVWAYRDAQKRGMEAILWALLVFFLHWIGLIIFLIVRSGKPILTGPPAPPAPPAPQVPPAPPAPPTPPPAKPAFCPSCGKPVHAEWSLCPFCGFKI